MNVVWRKGVLGASGAERALIRRAEYEASQRAICDAYEERCRCLDSILVDASDLTVRRVSTKWARSNGHLYLIIAVHHRPAGRVRLFRWCKSMPKRRSRER